MNISSLKFSTSSLIFFSLAAGFTLLLIATPLFNTLGYEFALAQGVFLPLVVGLFILSEKQPGSLWLNMGLATTLPLLIMLISMLFIRNCNPMEGFFFYLLGPVIGSVFSASLALLLKSMGLRLLKTAYVVIGLCVLFLPLGIQFYSSPQIYFFNHIFGYFAGPIYDRVVEIDSRYIFFRLETLLWSLAMFGLAYREKLIRKLSWQSLFAILSGIVIGAGAILFNYHSLGIEASHQEIEKRLFRINPSKQWYAPKEMPSEQKAYINRRLTHEIRYLKRSLKLEYVPEIKIYIYPNQVVKKRFTGAGRTEFTKIWRNEIHITLEGFERSIRHELVHILFGQFGIPGLGISKSIGLLEGIAEAYESKSLNWTLNEYSAAMFKLNLAPKRPETLLSAFGFWTGLGSKSYTLMGSFVSYLIQMHGIDAFKSVFARANFKDVYNQTPEKLIEGWKASLENIPISDDLMQATRYRFERKSLFQTQCPHTVARLIRAGNQAINKRRFGQAREAFGSILDLTDGKNPSALYGLIKTELYDAAFNSNTPFKVARLTADSLVKRIEKQIPAKYLILNTSAWQAGQLNRNDSLDFVGLLNKPLSYSYSLAIWYRLLALEYGLPMNLFSSIKSDEESLLQISLALSENQTARQSALLNLLLAERLFTYYNHRKVIERLTSAPEFDVAVVEFRKQMLLLQSYLRTHQFEKAEKIANMAHKTAGELIGANAKRLWINDQLDLYSEK